ncbi:MAG: glycosyltransferase [Candidatus Methylomirabilia bacterium]
MQPSASPAPAPIRVLQLLVSTALGGGPKHVFDLVRRLPRDELSAVVAAPADGPFFERFESLGVEVVELPLNRLRPWTLAGVLRVVRERRVQIIHSHGKGAGLYGRLAGRWVGVPAVHTFHGIHHAKYPGGVRELYLRLERYLARLSEAVIHVSESQAREAQRLGLADPGRSHVVVNGIDAEEVRVLAEQLPLSRQALGLSREAQVLGCVARFDEVKGLDLLVESLRRLADRYPRLALVLVGSGKREGQLHKRVMRAGLAERVQFAGPLAEPCRLFPLLDLYVSASRGEGLPYALLEAMACGLAVVATRVTGHVDAVQDGVTGLLTRPEDPEDLAVSVARLLDDPELRRKLGRAGSERVESRFGLEPMVAQLARLYRQAVAARR